jgi:hypothetical protein
VLVDFRGLIGRRAIVRLLAVTAISALAIAGIGAKCIEKAYVYVDSEGYTHITGRLVNETDIQGTNLVLRGTLLDGAGNVIATKDQAPCPPDLKPYSETMFDIRFDNPNVPPHASFKVNMVSGKALPAPLPDPNVVIFTSDAIRFTGIPFQPGILPFDESDVLIGFQVRNRTDNLYPVQGCAAVFDQQGQIIYGQSVELVRFDEDFGAIPAVTQPQELAFVTLIAEDVPSGPIQVKAWLWFAPKDSPTSQWQWIESGFITIRTIPF